VTLTVLTVVLLLTFRCYAIGHSDQVVHAADAGRYEVYKPIAAGESASFADLQAINPDVFSWLTVYGTHIDYPVVQGQDNIQYLNTDATGQHIPSGAIFLDYRNGPDFSDFSSILYGHHMENKVMFGEIALFSAQDYFDARRYGALYFDGVEHGLEFFAFVHADAYDLDVFRVDMPDRDERQTYLDLLLQRATHTRRDVSVTAEDRIVLLSTCSSDSANGRDILIGKVTDEPFSDPFLTAYMHMLQPRPMVHELSGLWSQLALWIKLCIAGQALLLIALTATLLYNKQKHAHGKATYELRREGR